MDSCKSVKIHPPFSKICPFLIHTGLGLLHFSFPCFVSLLVAPVPGLFCCLVGDVYPGVCLSIYLSYPVLSCCPVLSYPIYLHIAMTCNNATKPAKLIVGTKYVANRLPIYRDFTCNSYQGFPEKGQQPVGC